MFKRIYRVKLWILLLVLLGFIGSACHKLLAAPSPSDTITADAVFSSDATAQAAMYGFYNQVMNSAGGVLNGNISLYAGLSADELAPLKSSIPEDSFYLNKLTASSTLSGNLFSSAYTYIYGLNSILLGIHRSTGMSADAVAQLDGEARFLRALLYFYLVNLYGGVPLITSTDYAVDSRLPRASVDSVYQQLVRDLLAAQQELPANYITATSANGSDRTRPVQAAATALLARVYLYEGLWAQAEQAAGGVIGDPRFVLEPSMDSVFVSSSREAIWQLQPVYDTLATGDAHYFLPVSSGSLKVPVYYLPPSLLSSFEVGDQRRLHWTGNASLGPKTYVYPYKYKQSSSRAGRTEYEMVLRLAEQYLVRAEARARQGNVVGAMADVNVIRVRAGLPLLVATDQATVINAILAERRVELLTEWGNRWFDLKRLGQADAVLSVKPGWVSTAVLYPIPGYELLGNPNVSQNPGYGIK